MTRGTPVQGVVAVLRADPADAARSRRAALLQEVVASRTQRQVLEEQLTALDAKISFLRSQADALLDAPVLSAEEDDRWLEQALATAVRTDAGIVAERSAQQRSAAGGNRPLSSAADLHEIAVLAAMEPQEGPPRSLALVLPVSASVHTDWSAHGDDLQARLAWRVVGALAGVLKATGAGDAPLRFDRFEDCLSIQVWLGDASLDPSLRKRLTEAFEEVHAAAEELKHAQLDLFVAWVEPRMISGRRS